MVLSGVDSADVVLSQYLPILLWVYEHSGYCGTGTVLRNAPHPGKHHKRQRQRTNPAVLPDVEIPQSVPVVPIFEAIETDSRCRKGFEDVY